MFANSIIYETIAAMDVKELLFHPVRLRIVQAAHRGEHTTSDLAEKLPDVPKATLYRQVALLADGGLLEVVGEQRIRGAVERRYRLRPDRAVIDDAAAAAMTVDDHRNGFATVVAVLLAEFELYLARADSDPVADSIGYRQISLWLDDDEKAALLDEMISAIRARTGNAPRPGRRRHLLTPIFFPAEAGGSGQ
jgi:Helix-turn-helix domain